MSKRFIVVEVTDPTSVKGVENIWVPLDSEEDSIANGFQSLRNSGQEPTGVFQRVEVVNGEVRRVEKFEVLKRFANDGFRTMSAFLRA